MPIKEAKKLSILY